MTLRVEPVFAIWIAVLVAAVPLAAGAAEYPTKPIRLVVPSAPGGGTDIIARLIAQGLGDAWKQTVVVDNRGGAGGVAGVTIVAKQSAADGYTMLLGSVGHLAFVPAVRTNLGYDPLKDLTPISLAAVQPFLVAASLSLPAGSMKELVALAKSKPDSIKYGSGGSGSASHLGIELLQLTAGIKMLHVPYKGSNPAITALMGNEIQIALAGLATVLPHARGGRLKALAVTGVKRAQIAPEVPTVAESGVPGYELTNWFGLVLPGATAQDISRRIAADVSKVLAQSDIRDKFSAMGATVVGSAPEQFGAFMRAESDKWGKLIAEAGIQAQ